jgi:hypothetical protein
MKRFITFGGDGQHFYDAGNRLINQVQNLNIFDETQLYTDEYLKKDTEFWTQHGDFIIANPRGYGYWLWKPYILKKNLEKMREGDILLYLDCGCEIDIRKKNELEKQIENVKTEKYIGSYTHTESEWTKIDLFHLLDMVEDKYLYSPQRQGGILLFLVCDKIIQMVNEWYSYACHYPNINDTPSSHPNICYFQEHRHDQSIFSLLSKKNGFGGIYTLDNCVEIIRNISGNSRINYQK